MRVAIMRRLLASLVAGLALLAVGCDNEASADPGRLSQWPAAAAGAACQLLDYDAVATQLGTRFDTAGAAGRDDTFTCALTRQGHEYPDLTLAMTASAADEVIFTATVVPSGSTAVKGLGRIAYRLRIDASGGANARGPGVEVGWLSARRRIMILRYTFPPGATQQQADGLTTKLIGLARQTDRPAA